MFMFVLLLPSAIGASRGGRLTSDETISAGDPRLRRCCPKLYLTAMATNHLLQACVESDPQQKVKKNTVKYLFFVFLCDTKTLIEVSNRVRPTYKIIIIIIIIIIVVVVVVIVVVTTQQ